MEDDFGFLYRGLIAWIDPDPARLRQGLRTLRQAISCHDPPEKAASPLQSYPKYDIPGTEIFSRTEKPTKVRKEHERIKTH